MDYYPTRDWLCPGEEGKLVEPPPEYRYLLNTRPEEDEAEERPEPMLTAEQRLRPR